MREKTCKAADGLSLIDDFMIEEILGEETDAAPESVLEGGRSDIARAEILLRKDRMTALRMQIERERAASNVIPMEPDRMRAKLLAAANDPKLKMTLAARGAVAGDDADLESLLEDMAELEHDANDDVGN